jgi:hypothetical protein
MCYFNYAQGQRGGACVIFIMNKAGRSLCYFYYEQGSTLGRRLVYFNYAQGATLEVSLIFFSLADRTFFLMWRKEEKYQ